MVYALHKWTEADRRCAAASSSRSDASRQGSGSMTTPPQSNLAGLDTAGAAGGACDLITREWRRRYFLYIAGHRHTSRGSVTARLQILSRFPPRNIGPNPPEGIGARRRERLLRCDAGRVVGPRQCRCATNQAAPFPLGAGPAMCRGEAVTHCRQC